MLSLPLIVPQEDPSTFCRTGFRPRSASPPPSSIFLQSNQHSQLLRQAQQRRDDERKAQNAARSPLTFLAADEAAIAARKATIRNFGAYWIKPPGVPKTLQAMNEEEAERLEQEELARQEQGLLDMQAQQRLAEAHERAPEAAVEAEAAAEVGEERDLDDDIPDATDATADVSFNEDSMVDGSSQLLSQPEAEDQEREQNVLNMEEAEITGATRDEEELDIERDLDDSVPDAESYQHTDTEIEASSSESELQDSFVMQSARRSGRAVPQHPLQPQPHDIEGFQERTRFQIHAGDTQMGNPTRTSSDLSSSLLESPFVGSSPAMQRPVRAGRGGRTAGRSG